MEFTIVDAIVAVVVVVSAILAYSRGFVRETLAIGGWVVAAIAAYYFAPQAEPLMKEIPVLSDLIAGSCEISMIAAFAAVFALGLIVMSIFTALFASIIQRSALSGVDRGLGFLFGVLRGLLIVAIAFIIYGRVVVGEPIAVVDNSQSAKMFSQLQVSLADQIPEEAPQWVVARYEELLGDCPGAQLRTPSTPPAPAEAPAAGEAPAEGGTAGN
jgi:membrane protein required for colicin V production